MAALRTVLFGLHHTGYSAKDTNKQAPYVAGRRMLDFPGGHFKYLDYLADPHLVAIGVTSQLPTEWTASKDEVTNARS